MRTEVVRLGFSDRPLSPLGFTVSSPTMNKSSTSLRNICKIAERWDASDQMAQSIFQVFQLDLGFWEEAVAAGEGSPERTRAHVARTRGFI